VSDKKVEGTVLFIVNRRDQKLNI